MSRSEWERGSITLPAAAVAGLRQALVDASNAAHERAYTQARAWVQQQPSRANSKLRAALYANNLPEDVHRVISYLLFQIPAKPVRLPTHADVDFTAPRATSRTCRFTVGDEAEIFFTGRVVNWSVEENNHAVERAHEHPIGVLFFRALDRIAWTRGTGGQLIGNDEYNQDSREQGGGGNYVTATFGPRTAQQLQEARFR